MQSVLRPSALPALAIPATPTATAVIVHGKMLYNQQQYCLLIQQQRVSRLFTCFFMDSSSMKRDRVITEALCTEESGAAILRAERATGAGALLTAIDR